MLDPLRHHRLLDPARAGRFERGSFVCIVELEACIEETVADIGAFDTRLVTEDRVMVLAPDNAMLARTVPIDPRDRPAVAGKLPAPAASGEEAAPDKVP